MPKLCTNSAQTVLSHSPPPVYGGECEQIVQSDCASNLEQPPEATLDPYLTKVRASLAKVFGGGIVWFQTNTPAGPIGGKHQGGGVFGVGDKAVRLKVDSDNGR